MGALPLLYFIVTIVGSLDMPCGHKSVIGSSSEVSRPVIIPVFIITWVVARLTFFLNPAHDMAPVTQNVRTCYRENEAIRG